MRTPTTLRTVLVLGLLAAATAGEATAPKATLKPFASEAELAALFTKWTEEHKRRLGERRESAGMAAPQSYTSSVVAKAAAGRSSRTSRLSSASVSRRPK